MTLKEWLASVAAELDVTDAALDPEAVRTLLDVTRDCAHQVERVAAPLTSYLLGVAVGRGATLDEATATTRALLSSAGQAGAAD
jgi:hypothetical protein